VITPENERWCVLALAAVLTVAYLAAKWLERRYQLRQGRRLDQSGGDR
jgi:hypothetical protein